MIILVTGGAGFIGSSLVTRLIDRGDAVRVLDDLSTGLLENIPDGADLIQGDVADAQALGRAMTDVEIVFHEAAARSVIGSVENPLATDRVNTHGTLAVLKAAVDAGVRRVITASSSSVYGGTRTSSNVETDAPSPRSPYAVSKLAGEHYCRVFADLYNLETIALRYFNVYGPRQRPNSLYAAVIPLFIRALEHNERPVVHGDGHQSRDFTFIDDVVDANLAAACVSAETCTGATFNIACGGSHSLLELLEVLGRVMDTGLTPVHVAPRQGDIRHSQADISAARLTLGFEAKVSFEEGIRRTVAWYRSVGMP